MTQPLTKAMLRRALKTKDAGIARFFRVSRAAITQWPEDEPIPELRLLQVEKRRPDIIRALEAGETFDDTPRSDVAAARATSLEAR